MSEVASYRVSGTESAKSIYLRLGEQNSPLPTLGKRELEAKTGQIGAKLNFEQGVKIATLFMRTHLWGGNQIC